MYIIVKVWQREVQQSKEKEILIERFRFDFYFVRIEICCKTRLSLLSYGSYHRILFICFDFVCIRNKYIVERERGLIKKYEEWKFDAIVNKNLII